MEKIVCSRCHKLFESDGYKTCPDCRKYRRKQYKKNGDEERTQRRGWYTKNRERELVRGHNWREAHPDRIKEYQKNWKEKYPGRKNELARKAYYKNHESRLKRDQELRKERRLRVLTHYCTHIPLCCACCGENNYEFLTLDHIDGGGTKHRKTLKITAGKDFYAWIIRNDFPVGYRVLCMNCNFSFGVWGYCPHEGRKEN
jgi:hypothetical protein